MISITPGENSPTAKPCTLLTIGPSILKLDELKAKVRRFAETDDVWSSEFLECVVLQILEGEYKITEGQRQTLSELGARNVYSFHQSKSSFRPPDGPYFLDYGRPYYAYRLYPDTSGAFGSCYCAGC